MSANGPLANKTVPDDVWTHVVGFLAPPPPALMSPAVPSLVSAMVERWRTPSRSITDLITFSLTSKKFRILSRQHLFAYISVDGENDMYRLSASLSRGTDAAPLIGPCVLGITFAHGSASFRGLEVSGMQIFAHIVSNLPKLHYVDLGGASAASSDVILALATSNRPLRSIVGLGLDSENYISVAHLLSRLGTSIRSLGLVEIKDMSTVLKQAGPAPLVDMPHLLRLDFEPFIPSDYNDVPEQTVLLRGWKAPLVRTVAIGINQENVGEGTHPEAVLGGFASSVQEYTLPLWSVAHPNGEIWLNACVHLKVLAVHLIRADMWTAPQTHGPPLVHTGVETLILVQESIDDAAMALTARELEMQTRLALFASNTTFPSLRRVYYLVEEVGGHIWLLWAQIAVDLVKAGVDVVYL